MGAAQAGAGQIFQRQHDTGCFGNFGQGSDHFDGILHLFRTVLFFVRLTGGMDHRNLHTGVPGGFQQTGLKRIHILPAIWISHGRVDFCEGSEGQVDGGDGYVICLCLSVDGFGIVYIVQRFGEGFDGTGGQLHVVYTGFLHGGEHFVTEVCGRTGRGERPVVSVCHDCSLLYVGFVIFVTEIHGFYG